MYKNPSSRADRGWRTRVTLLFTLKMDIKNKIWQLGKWKIIKKRLNYSDGEMETFRNNPQNEIMLAKAPEVSKARIVATVIESHGCNSKHLVGEKFYFDGFGNLLTEHCPKKICIYALNAIVPQLFAANEMMLADVDPNTMRFNRASCFDVGVRCGGVGRIALEITTEKQP